MSRRTTTITIAVVAALLVVVGGFALVRRDQGAGTDVAQDPSTATSGPSGTAAGSTTSGTVEEPTTTGSSTTAAPAPSTAGQPTTARPPSSPGGPGGPGAGPGGGGSAGPTAGRLAGVSTWAFGLGADLSTGGPGGVAARFAGYDLVVIDGADASPSVVGALHAQGSIVLAYLSVGTVEQHRSWTAAAQPYLLDRWEDWDETYADVGQPGFRDLIAASVAPSMLDKGFDGLFLDNVDMVDTHPAQQPGMVELVRRLSELAHQRGGVLFTQNGDTSVDAFAGYLDGWNREDVSATYDFDREGYAGRSAAERAEATATIARLRARGLLVTAVDYTAAAQGPAVDDAVRTACAAGAVPYVSDIGLTRVPPVPPRC